MPGRGAVRAVIFDWGGTLTPWRAVDLREQWRAFAAELHADDPAVAEELARQILAAESRAWQRSREQHRSARLEDVLAEAGVDLAHAGLPAARAAYERFWEPHTRTDPVVRPLWERLHADGVRIGVLSNTLWSREYHRALFDRDGLLGLLDGDVYSSEIAWAKPHAAAFRAAAAAVGVPPDSCVYVGDRLYEDVHGPQQAGMRAVWVPHSDLPAEQRVEVDVEPDAVVESLAELTGVLRRWGTPTTAR
ncbi:HAD family hydrolase [Ornithinicoccus halotolerans]|uniref:HAD family hydrolase n=1 Tax=Ornithinicoccus halotolerans TaxID=1748220 RepID=UPI001297CA2B|nr:HAD family hydrolase [Ornithinicoccus halotolerans]